MRKNDVTLLRLRKSQANQRFARLPKSTAPTPPAAPRQIEIDLPSPGAARPPSPFKGEGLGVRVEHRLDDISTTPLTKPNEAGPARRDKNHGRDHSRPQSLTSSEAGALPTGLLFPVTVGIQKIHFTLNAGEHDAVLKLLAFHVEAGCRFHDALGAV